VKQKPHRPPFAPENDLIFSAICPECNGDCEKVCEEGVIKIIDETPHLDFSNSGCTYCEECVNVCEKNVLNFENEQKIQSKVELNILSCVAWQNVICSSCRDACLDNAIQFLGMFRPEINYEKCTNCGFCISTCPTQAISLLQNSK
jgi:ferredoxin-type protein NapF